MARACCWASTGVLLRGPSGAGKSVLALSLLDRWEGRGLPAFLVSDDRVDLAVTGRQLSMQAPAKLAGLIELRGRGIVSRPHTDLVTLAPRHRSGARYGAHARGRRVRDRTVWHDLARAPVPYGSVISLGHQILLVVEAIAALGPAVTKYHLKSRRFGDKTDARSSCLAGFSFAQRSRWILRRRGARKYWNAVGARVAGASGHAGDIA